MGRIKYNTKLPDSRSGEILTLAGTKCGVCGGSSIISDHNNGERVCGSCGYVTDEKLEVSAQRISRVTIDVHGVEGFVNSITLTKPDMGLNTTISKNNFDVNGKPLKSALRTSIERLRVWDSRLMTSGSKEKNLKQAMGELGRVSEKLNVSPSTKEEAAYIYRKVLEKDFVKGRSMNSIVAASIYAACRESDTPRTLSEVSAVSNIKRREIAMYYRGIIEVMDYELRINPPTIAKCVSKVCNKLKLGESFSRRALDIAKRAQEAELNTGKDQMGFAGGVVYFAYSQEKNSAFILTQSDIAAAAGVTEVTIRNRYRGIDSVLNGTQA